MTKKYLPEILVVFILIAGIFLRVYHFDRRVNFSQEQAMALDRAAQMIETKQISLIGVPYFIRQTSTGHEFFNSGAYLYPIVLAQKLFGFHPLPITLSFAFINVLSGLLLWQISRRITNQKAALIALILFMFNPLMIEYSLFVWHINLLIPISIFWIYSFYLFGRNTSASQAFLIGFWGALGFSLHISFFFIFSFSFFWICRQVLKTKNLKSLIAFGIGATLGYSPLIVFDLRHNFYNFKTMLEFIFSSPGTGFTWQNYHFIFAFPIILITASWLVSKTIKSPRMLVLLLGLLIVYWIPFWSLNKAYGMPVGWTLSAIEKSADLISRQKSEHLNVASLLDGETRALTIRYFLQHIHHTPLLDVTAYPQTQTLYVVGRTNPSNSQAWEIQSAGALKLSQYWPIQQDIYLYRLDKK